MPAKYSPSMSAEKVKERTGKTWDEWFTLLDAWGAKAKGHKKIAEHLASEYGIPGWWCQTVTVEYERSRGVRKVGQVSTGDFEVSMQRTVERPPAQAMVEWTDGRRRAKWLTDPDLRDAFSKARATARTAETSQGPVFRIDLPGSGVQAVQRLEVLFLDKGRDRTAVSIQHRGIRSSRERDAWKRRWGPVMDAMRRSLSAQ